MTDVTVAHQWRGVIQEYPDRLPVTGATPVVTLGEGGTPLVPRRASPSAPAARSASSSRA